MELGNIQLCEAFPKPGRMVFKDTSMVWKAAEGERTVVLEASKITALKWLTFGNHKEQNLLQVQSTDKSNRATIFRFGGFSETRDHERVTEFVRTKFGKEISADKLDVRGANWGEVTSTGHSLILVGTDEEDVERPIVELPFSDIAQCVAPTKNELELQFHEDDTVDKEDEVLVEMRFFVPATNKLASEEKTAVQHLQQVIQGAANIQDAAAGDAIVEFHDQDMMVMAPRGRYDIDMHAADFRMHGKTYDFKVQYKNISRFFLLPKPDGKSAAFVICLSEPIRQGKQRYNNLVINVGKKDVSIDVKLDEETRAAKFADLTSPMQGPLSKVVAKCFAAFSGEKVFVPDDFKSKGGHRCVRCAVRSNEGLLYPLGNGFFFIHKPATFVRFRDIKTVQFMRHDNTGSGAAQRTFDLRVLFKSANAEGATEISFSSIDRSEYDGILGYLEKNKISIMNLEAVHTADLGSDDSDAEESEDSDFAGGDDDEEDEDDDGEDDEDSETEKGGKPKAKSTKGKKRTADADGGAAAGAGAGAGAGRRESKRRRGAAAEEDAGKTAEEEDAALPDDEDEFDEEEDEDDDDDDAGDDDDDEDD